MKRQNLGKSPNNWYIDGIFMVYLSTALGQIGNPWGPECTMALPCRKIYVLQHVDPGLHYLLHWSHITSAGQLQRLINHRWGGTHGRSMRNETAGSATGFNRFYRIMHTMVGSTQDHRHLLDASFFTKTK